MPLSILVLYNSSGHIVLNARILLGQVSLAMSSWSDRLVILDCLRN